ncbi:NADPH-dependent F420 reductase [Burkholderia sp. IMCC1007]|uniref:NADPH-dependent F420 reductase n=1 Tax=Burkholderia sp. IMCC1007 TaxID=3004104 RepID=UPI0022B49EE2|nr:hypothetical protein [Burkholderia sp. IMCC1007]
MFKPIDLGTRASSEVVADLVPGARVVKGFNHLQPHLLSGDPSSEGGKRVLFYSGDDLAAKHVVGALIERLGFFGIDLGSLAMGAPCSIPRRPLAISQSREVRLIRNPRFRRCSTFSHGMPTANADVLNAELLAFSKA